MLERSLIQNPADLGVGPVQRLKGPAICRFSHLGGFDDGGMIGASRRRQEDAYRGFP
jgi:hypothetical protein